MRTILSFGLALLAGSFGVGCGGSAATPQPLTPPANEVAFPSADYRIENGDIIEITSISHPELKQEHVIQPDGRLRVEGIGEIEVVGRTTSEVTTDLETRARERLRDPQVAVTIVGYAPRSVYVTGEVLKPGPVDFRKGLTPLRAVIEAGGFRETAKTDNVMLIRGAGKDLAAKTLNLHEVVTQGAPEPLALAPRDVIYVPKTGIAIADLWVDQHVTRLFPFIRGTSTSVPLGF